MKKTLAYLVLLLTMFVSVSAFADFGATQGSGYGRGGSISEVCNRTTATTGSTCSGSLTPTATCAQGTAQVGKQVLRCSNSSFYFIAGLPNGQYSCPTDATISGFGSSSMCTCNTGTYEENLTGSTGCYNNSTAKSTCDAQGKFLVHDPNTDEHKCATEAEAETFCGSNSVQSFLNNPTITPGTRQCALNKGNMTCQVLAATLGFNPCTYKPKENCEYIVPGGSVYDSVGIYNTATGNTHFICQDNANNLDDSKSNDFNHSGATINGEDSTTSPVRCGQTHSCVDVVLSPNNPNFVTASPSTAIPVDGNPTITYDGTDYTYYDGWIQNPDGTYSATIGDTALNFNDTSNVLTSSSPIGTHVTYFNPDGSSTTHFTPSDPTKPSSITHVTPGNTSGSQHSTNSGSGGGDTGGGGGDTGGGGGDTGGGDTGGGGGDTGGGDTGGGGGDTGGGGGDTGGGDDDGEESDCEECDILTNILNTLRGEGTDGESLLASILDDYQGQIDTLGESFETAFNELLDGLPVQETLDELGLNPIQNMAGAGSNCSYTFSFLGTSQTISYCEWQTQIHALVAFFSFLMFLFGVREIVFERPQ